MQTRRSLVAAAFLNEREENRMERYVIALDQGTTSSRAVVFDESARVIAIKSFEFPQIYPQPGWVEHDAEEIWSTMHEMILQAMKPITIQKAEKVHVQ